MKLLLAFGSSDILSLSPSSSSPTSSPKKKMRFPYGQFLITGLSVGELSRGGHRYSQITDLDKTVVKFLRVTRLENMVRLQLELEMGPRSYKHINIYLLVESNIF